MNASNESLLILGVGNYLMGDEGVGVHFAKQLEQEDLPENVSVVDGGTGGFTLLEYLDAYPTIIIVDATMDANPNGTIRLIEPRFASDFPKTMSTHEIGLKDLIESLAIMDKMPKIYLFVVTIDIYQDLNIELSPAIEAALPELKNRVLRLVDELVPNNQSYADSHGI